MASPARGIPEKMEEYREFATRKLLPRGYSGHTHLGLLFAASLGLSALCALLARGASLAELSVVPVTFVYGNLVEYSVHRWPMHQSRWKPLRFLRRSHLGVHHRFYNFRHMMAACSDDWYFTLFPLAFYCFYFLVAAAPVALGLLPLLPRRAQLLAAATASFYLAWYEVVHSFHHRSLPPPLQAALERLPPMQAMREHHRLHHHWRLMRTHNFNITLPLWDAVLGTRYTGAPPPDEQREAAFPTRAA